MLTAADETMYSEDDGWEFITLADQVCECAHCSCCFCCVCVVCMYAFMCMCVHACVCLCMYACREFGVYKMSSVQNGFTYV